VSLDPLRLENAYQTARAALLAERSPKGHWVGELSTSALSTAVAVSALALVQKAGRGSFDALISGGLSWLATHQNADGGWGDTVKSFSNISTTMLCRSAFHLTRTAARHDEAVRKSEAWLAPRYGTTPEQIAEAVRARYGKDRTFSVPILMTSALAGLVAWREVPSLPFELACFPQSWFRFLGLPVVSYALPALIAIGQAVYHHRPPRNPVVRFLRRRAINKSLRVLAAIQPSNGGFLEATPLTSFVALGLASSGRPDHPVVGKCVEFITASVRPDGSWPIDTNLSTWVTTLAVNALAAAGELKGLDKQKQMRDWLLAQQYQDPHPFTGAEPGGWGWTPLPGSVPDADDSPGALLALFHLSAADPLLAVLHPMGGMQIPRGCQWLLHLANRDGGWPTFCRGWTKLPFDRSGADLTAHVLRALSAWRGQLQIPAGFLAAVREGRYADSRLLCDWGVVHALRLDLAIQNGFTYLARAQRPDGSWLPLWFGNQHAPEEINPTYGTARVLAAYRDLDRMDEESARRGVRWLVANQNADGGWGGLAGTPSSVEETALAVEALLDAPEAADAVNNGLTWLVQQVEAGRLFEPTPIGFYFAKLWYFEKLYPIIFSVAALGRARANAKPLAAPAVTA
jgi:squalene-hopene/tetraprenyl-beta-curcumene cyclase